MSAVAGTALVVCAALALVVELILAHPELPSKRSSFLIAAAFSLGAGLIFFPN